MYMKKIFKYFASTMLLAGLVFVSCSKDDLAPVTPEEDGIKAYTLTITASKEKAPDTKLLELGGVDNKTLYKKWALNDEVSVYKGTTLAGTLRATTVSSDGFDATLTGQLTGTTIVTGDDLVMKFRTPNYSAQDGTLAGIASTCDYAEAEVTVASVDGSGNITTTADALFKSQQAIVKFTLKNDSGDLVPVTKLTIKTEGATDRVVVTPASGASEVFVALAGVSSKNLILEAKGSDGFDYSFRKADVTFDHSKYYGINVKMFCANTTPLTLMAKGNGTISFFLMNDSDIQPITYRLNNGAPQTIEKGGSGTTITVSEGDKVAFYGNNTFYGDGTITTGSKFSSTVDYYLYGNVMSLIDAENFASLTTLTHNNTFSALFYKNTRLFNHSWKAFVLPAKTVTSHCYDSMFGYCNNLTKAPDLPATTIGEYCYSRMFEFCTGLTTVPEELPAQTLKTRCYSRMFAECNKITTAPALKGTATVNGCYGSMFYNCSNLVTIPASLPGGALENNCYDSMFYGCGKIVTAPSFTATSVGTGSCANMFYECKSLTTARNISIDCGTGTLSGNCCKEMFRGCKALTEGPAVFTGKSAADGCCNSMFRSCTNLTTAPASLPATTVGIRSYYYMFAGCAKLETAPTLPATTLNTQCYYAMFLECEKLNYVKCLATDISASDCTTDWLSGVASEGTFIKAAGMTSWTPDSVNGIPSGWTVSDAS